MKRRLTNILVFVCNGLNSVPRLNFRFKQRQFFGLAFSFFLLSTYAYAGQPLPSDTSLFGIGVSAEAGTLGYGGSLNFKCTNYIQVKLGYSILENTIVLPMTISSQKLNVDLNIKSGGYTLLCEVYPSKKKSFHFLAGIAKVENSYVGKASLNDKTSYGMIVYNPDQIGYVDFTLTGNSWLPIFGIGIGRSVPKHRVGIGFDAGIMYQGKLNATINATNAFTPIANPENEQIIANAFSSYQILPFINFRINFKIY